MSSPRKANRTGACVLGLAALGAGPLASENKPTGQPEMFSVFVAGDAIINQPWRHIADPDFLEVIRHSREASISVVNLETTLGDFSGFPQKHSGGTYFMARPHIADELVWAGIDLVGGANNHSFDYGSVGVLTTLEAVASAGLTIAGIGKDLQHARRVAVVEREQKSVALASVTSTFKDYWVAGTSHANMHGRPGLNPLGVLFQHSKPVRFLTHANKYIFDELARFGVSMRGIRLHGIDQRDLTANLSELRSAEAQNDYVVLSIHAHQTGVWLEDFAHQAIDAGVDVFISHGPHVLAGIEIYKGRPIFYGLGNFVMQFDQVEKLPAESFERAGLSPHSSTEEYFAAMDIKEGRHASFRRRKDVWESIAAVVHFEQDRLVSVELVPLDLGFRQPKSRRGVPMKAGPELARHIVTVLQRASKRYRTHIEFRSDTGTGLIRLPPRSH